MKVFISWSGATSHKVAMAFRDWLPLVVQAAIPFVSSEDITKGTNWSARLDEELATSVVGIIVVTSENMRAPWLNFEAGMLARSLRQAAVCPVLVDVNQADIAGSPLSQFQCTSLDVDDLCRLAEAILRVGRDVPHSHPRNLRKVVQKLYPVLRKEITRILAPGAIVPTVNPRGVSTPASADLFFSENYVEHSSAFKAAISGARSLSVCGFGHNRMSVVHADALSRILRTGGHLRVLCMDPLGEAVLLANNRSFAPKTTAGARHQHEAGIATLEAIGRHAPEQQRYELRVIDLVPPFTMYLFNEHEADAEVYVWFAPYKQPSAARPGFRMVRSEGSPWYARFVAQFEALWDAATPRNSP